MWVKDSVENWMKVERISKKTNKISTCKRLKLIISYEENLKLLTFFFSIFSVDSASCHHCLRQKCQNAGPWSPPSLTMTYFINSQLKGL